MVAAPVILPGTGRGTMRSMVEGLALNPEQPLHPALRARSPSPFRGGT